MLWHRTTVYFLYFSSKWHILSTHLCHETGGTYLPWNLHRIAINLRQPQGELFIVLRCPTAMPVCLGPYIVCAEWRMVGCGTISHLIIDTRVREECIHHLRKISDGIFAVGDDTILRCVANGYLIQLLAICIIESAFWLGVKIGEMLDIGIVCSSVYSEALGV